MPPGLEDLALIELNVKAPGLNLISKQKGGLLLEAPLVIGLTLNLYLKIPSSILLRVAEFKCRDLPKLYNKVASIKWSKYLVGSDFRLDVSSRQSRMLNEKKIAKSVSEGIERFFAKQPAKKVENSFSLEVKVRFAEDICTLSINTTGDLLHKRDYKMMKGVAPLRENLAAGLFWALWQHVPEFDVLIDPMCGTGTLLTESAVFWLKQNRINYDFLNKEGWCATELAYLDDSKILRIYGYDRDKKNIEYLHKTLGALNLQNSSNWTLAVRDLFKDEPTCIEGERKVVICNPPYGVRLQLPQSPQIYYNSLISKMLDFHPLAIGIIIPTRFAKSVIKNYSSYKLQRLIEFENGGIPVGFHIFTQN